MDQNKATLKHTVTQEEIEQYAGMEIFDAGQVIDVHVPLVDVEVLSLPSSALIAADDLATPDGYVGTRPGKGRG